MNSTNEHATKNRRSGRPHPAVRKAIDAFQTGQLDDAQTLARDIVAASPEQEEAWRILAAVAQRQGRMKDVGQILRDGIAKNPKSVALFTMLGLMLRDIGRLNEAETALRHALTLDAAQADAALNLGNLLAQRGRFHEAEAVFRAAGEKMPQEPRLPLQLGHVMLTLGNTELARQAFERAVALSREILARNGGKPQDPSLYVEAATHLGRLLLEGGERFKALDYFYDAVQLGGDESVRCLFADCVSAALPLITFQPLLKPLLVRAISETWIAPEDLMRQCTSQLMLDPDFSAPGERIELIAPDAAAPLLNQDVAKVTGDPLLRAMLEASIIPDRSLERLLTALRKLLLYARAEPDSPRARGSEGLLDFTVLLANQCFLTDYAYISSPEEDQIADRLTTRIGSACVSDGPIAMSDIAALASYRALHSLDCAEALLARDWPPSIEPVIQRQLREPRKEIELRKTIPRITAISDRTSEAVRAQYEENPFPRWSETAVRTDPFTLNQWLRTGFPHLSPKQLPPRAPDAPLSVLAAGCGTGREVIASATRFINSELLAVDLSLTSLAYAVRKTEQAGLTNVTYAQADILELDGIGRRFDIVECAGVLHHLAEPLAGWRVLGRLTKPGGYMLMALYSKFGRRDLDPATAFIAERGYGTTAGELRRFRADVLALPNDHPARKIAILRDDFFNLSMLRDLVFHVKERRFAIPDIGAALEELGLEFCGFAADPEIRLQFRERFGPAADFTSLADWDVFETEYPDTFSAMYHFLVRKPD